jgi:hypothetical protein
VVGVCKGVVSSVLCCPFFLLSCLTSRSIYRLWVCGGLSLLCSGGEGGFAEVWGCHPRRSAWVAVAVLASCAGDLELGWSGCAASCSNIAWANKGKCQQQAYYHRVQVCHTCHKACVVINMLQPGGAAIPRVGIDGAKCVQQRWTGVLVPAAGVQVAINATSAAGASCMQQNVCLGTLPGSAYSCVGGCAWACSCRWGAAISRHPYRNRLPSAGHHCSAQSDAAGGSSGTQQLMLPVQVQMFAWLWGGMVQPVLKHGWVAGAVHSQVQCSLADALHQEPNLGPAISSRPYTGQQLQQREQEAGMQQPLQQLQQQRKVPIPLSCKSAFTGAQSVAGGGSRGISCLLCVVCTASPPVCSPRGDSRWQPCGITLHQQHTVGGCVAVCVFLGVFVRRPAVAASP